MLLFCGKTAMETQFQTGLNNGWWVYRRPWWDVVGTMTDTATSDLEMQSDMLTSTWECVLIKAPPFYTLSLPPESVYVCVSV